MADDPPSPTERRRPTAPEPLPAGPGREPGQGPGWRVEGGPPPEDKPPEGRRIPRMPGSPRIWWILVALLALNWFVVSLIPDRESRIDVPYTVFREQVQAGNVSEVTSRGDTIQGTFKKEVTYPADSDKKDTDFETERPAFADDGLLQLLIDQDVVVNAKPVDEGRPLLQTLLLSFGPVILLVLLFVFLARRAGGAGSAISGLGRSKAKRYDASGTRVTFEDVAGIDEAEDELVEIVDFLKNPDRYLRLGGRIPRGVLLAGPPGTGKTLLARAVAGEANVPFFSLSASEFVEFIVGVGASRVRDLFTQAKATAPAIIFIDELDAIGRARGGSASLGGNDEREQTLNQILTEMDGFSGTEGVIVLAATNRPEILDAALLRPGRFDRRVTVSPPDRDGRAAILRVHLRGVPLADDVDVDQIAQSTPGMVGADLAQPDQRGRAHGGAPQPRPRSGERLHRCAGADRAGGRAPHHDLAGRARAHGLPRERPRAPRDAAAGRGPGAQGLDRAPWEGPRGDLPGARRRPLRLRRGVPARSHRRAPSAAARPRRWCTAT